MALTYSATIKNSRMEATRADVANGTVEIATDGTFTTIIATWGLDATAGTVTGDAWTLVFDNATVTASASGTATAARIKDSVSAVQIDGLTVGAGSGDLNLDNNVINSGQSVTISSAVITHAA